MVGNPLCKDGAITLTKSIEGIIQMFSDMTKATLQANGIEVTPIIEQEILQYFKKQVEEYDVQFSKEGIPSKLQDLLNQTKKSKLKAYCSRITISEEELVLLVHNCSQIGYTHQSKFLEYVPENRRLSKIDRTVLIKNEPKKFFNKVRSIFNERKNYIVHLFEKGQIWHCFYYTYHEMEERNNQFKLGPHLHFVNYLWTEYSKNQVWKAFDMREHDIKGAHIRLQPFPEYESEGNYEFRELATELITKYKKS